MVEDVLVTVDKFLYPVDFVVLETERVANVANQIPVILGRAFLVTANVLINYGNNMIRLSFCNITL